MLGGISQIFKSKDHCNSKVTVQPISSMAHYDLNLTLTTSPFQNKNNTYIQKCSFYINFIWASLYKCETLQNLYNITNINLLTISINNYCKKYNYMYSSQIRHTLVMYSTTRTVKVQN